MNDKRECPHCHGSLERYEDPEAVKIIRALEKESDCLRNENSALVDAIAALKDFVEGNRNDSEKIAEIINGALKLSNDGVTCQRCGKHVAGDEGDICCCVPEDDAEQ